MLMTASVAALASMPARAADDDKAVCNSAYEATQTLKRQGKVSAARVQATVCIRDVCPEFMRTECTKWNEELEASQPTVVFEMKDASGHDMSAVRVSLDGAPWLAELEGKAHPIDPGQHTLRFEVAGHPAVEQSVQIREGEKNRVLSASFEITKATQAGLSSTAAASPSTEPAPQARRSIGPFVVGGVGVAGLVVFGVAGAITVAGVSSTHTGCSNVADTCGNAKEALVANAASSKTNTIGAVATTGLVVGVVGLGTGLVWLIASSPSKADPSSRVGLSFRGGPTQGSLDLKAIW